MRVLLDETVPDGLRTQFPADEVKSVQEMGWNSIVRGRLLALADAAGFDTMITGDLNIRYQNNLAARRIAIVAISTTHWPTVRANLPALRDAVESASAGAPRASACPDRLCGAGRHRLEWAVSPGCL